MADVEQLVARLSLDMRQFRSEMLKAQGISTKTAKSVESAWANTNRRLDSVGRGIGQSLIAPLTAVAAAASVREVAAYADAWTSAGNKLNAASQISGRQARSLESLNAIANDTRSGITETTDLYAKLLRSTKDVAKSEQEVATATTIVNKAFKAGGAEAKEQAAGILQLSQALGSGILQGDELRSLRENAPLVAQAIADEFGTTIAGLKKLGADGEITSARVFSAILKAQPQIEAAFNSTNQTIGDGVTKVNNALTQYIGSTDSSLGATVRLTQGLNALADNFAGIADTTLAVAGVIAGALVGRSIAGMITKLGLAGGALIRFVGALRAASGVAGVATAIGGIGAAAGPVGLAVGTVLTGALIAFGTSSDEASDAANAYAQALAEVEDAAKRTSGNIDELDRKFDAQKKNTLTGGIEVGKDKIQEASAAIRELFAEIIANAPRRLISEAQLKQLAELDESLASGKITASEANDALFELANADPKFQKLADQFKPLLDVLINAVAATDKLQEGLSNLTDFRALDDPRGQQTSALAQDRATKDFTAQRLADAKRGEDEKKLDARVKEIIAAADKGGIAITEAGAKIQAAMELAAEGVVASAAETAKAQSKSIETVADLIKQQEGFSAKAYYDVNAFRAGFGSDTVTLDDGSVRKVTEGMTVTLKQANDDLARRIGEFQDGIKGDIGGDTFAAFSEQQQAVLTSIAYNYGSLPDRIIKAIASGDQGVISTAIKGLGSDNGGVNRRRRNEEAAQFLGGASESVQAGVTADENFAEKIKQQKEFIANLQAETGIRQNLNPLVNDYGKALTTLEVAQELLNAAQEEGVAAGLELKDVQQLLTGDLSTLTPKAREQALAMRELANATGTAKAAGNELEESQKKLGQTLKETAEFNKDVFGGFISDLSDGKSAVEALENALGKVADKLLDIALNAVFDGGGGIFGSLFGSGGFKATTSLDNLISGALAKGGPVTKGKTYLVGEKGPELFTATGSGSIIPNSQLNPPSFSAAIKSQAPSVSSTTQFNIDARGAVEGTAEQIRKALTEYDRSVAPRTAVNSVQRAQKSGVMK